MTARPQNYRFHQGQKSLSFSAEEHADRIAGLRQIMDDNDVGVIVLTSQHNIAYYTGLVYRAFGRPYALVVTAHECVTVTPGVDGGQPSRRGHTDNITYTDWERSNFYRTVRSIAGIGKVVGYEADQVTVLQAQALRHHLHPTGLIDVSAETMRQQMYKSDAERALIRDGAAVAAVGVTTMRDTIKPGIREIDVAVAGRDAMELEIVTRFPQTEYRDTWAQCQSGINTDGAHNAPTTRPLQPGDILSLSAHPMISGYYTPQARTFFLGEADEASLRIWEANVAANAYGRSLITPGVSCAEVAAKMNAFYEERDLLSFRAAGLGHSLGVISHYDGRDATLDLREDNDAVLEAGMVITMEPMLTLAAEKPGAGGYCEQDVLFITEDGNETITALPYGFDDNVVNVS